MPCMQRIPPSPRGLKGLFVSLYELPVFEIQGCRKSEVCRMTSVSPWTLNCQKYPAYMDICTYTCTARPIFYSILLYDQPFSWYTRLSKIKKCTEWPQTDRHHLPVILPSIRWILTHHRVPNVIPFRFTTMAPFRDLFQLLIFLHGTVSNAELSGKSSIIGNSTFQK